MRKKYDAILLLGLRLNPDGSAQPEMIDRAKKACEIWRAGVAPVIVACGGPTGGSGKTEAEALLDALTDMGVPSESVILEDKSLITNENIVNARAILGAGKKNVALVTSDYHAFRARLICRRLGFRVKSFSSATQGGAEKNDKRKLECMFTIDFLMGWQEKGKKRPAWADQMLRRFAGPIFRRLEGSRREPRNGEKRHE